MWQAVAWCFRTDKTPQRMISTKIMRKFAVYDDACGK